MIRYIVWAMGAFAAYRLWEEVTWLAVIVVIIALSYAAHEDEQAYYQAHGEFQSSTAFRFLMTFILVLMILIYSLFPTNTQSDNGDNKKPLTTNVEYSKDFNKTIADIIARNDKSIYQTPPSNPSLPRQVIPFVKSEYYSPNIEALKIIETTCNYASNQSVPSNTETYATVDSRALNVTSKYYTLFGYSNRNSGLAITIWDGDVTLATNMSDTQGKLVSSTSGDHGGDLRQCEYGTSGKYGASGIWYFQPSVLDEGVYTVGIYSRSTIYTNKGFEGYTEPKLVSESYTLKVKY